MVRHSASRIGRDSRHVYSTEGGVFVRSMFNMVARAHTYTAQCNAASEQQPEGWRIVDPPPCLGGSTHRWVPVNTHSTLVPERDGCGWPMSSDSTAVQCRNTANTFFLILENFFFKKFQLFLRGNVLKCTGSHVYIDHSFQVTTISEITQPFSLE